MSNKPALSILANYEHLRTNMPQGIEAIILGPNSGFPNSWLGLSQKDQLISTPIGGNLNCFIKYERKSWFYHNIYLFISYSSESSVSSESSGSSVS